MSFKVKKNFMRNGRTAKDSFIALFEVLLHRIGSNRQTSNSEILHKYIVYD
jgi:hypothetical protein